MTWHYVAVKHTDEYGEVYYGLHEQYENLNSEQPVYTTEEVTVISESVAGLAKMLRAAADDVEKYKVIEETIE